MWRRRTWIVSTLFIGALVASFLQRSLEGCAPAPRPGQRVDIDEESALIVWDSQSRTEHFIRGARFQTAAEDFGFLVPTPTRPDLGEVDDGIFSSARRLTSPRYVTESRTRTVFGFGLILGEKASKSAARTDAMPQPVEILEQKKVAGFDATVLRAEETQALIDWLNEHGYESRPALTEWLKWYVEHRWIITAFKVSADPGGKSQQQVNSRTLRMSFQTDRPFYPYREPEDMRQPSGQGSRSLHVYVLSDKKYAGTLGEDGAWPGKLVWANQISRMEQDNLTERLRVTDKDLAQTLEGARYLTEFEDQSFPRPGTDEVYFQPAQDQASVERPPIIYVVYQTRYFPGLWGLLVVAIGGLLGVALLLRRWLKPSPTK